MLPWWAWTLIGMAWWMVGVGLTAATYDREKDQSGNGAIACLIFSFFGPLFLVYMAAKVAGKAIAGEPKP